MAPSSMAGWTRSRVPTAIDLRTSGEPRLVGTLHAPDGPPIATVLMVPGSGPTHRDNDTYFPPIRDGLLAAGIAVASFDKRGVGASEGDWHDTDPLRQAGDVAAQLASLRGYEPVAATPIGLFGHSQGGWVVLDVAAADGAVAFVVTNSGPGVTWARQGRYATAAHLLAAGEPPGSIEAALDGYDRIVGLVRDGAAFDVVQQAALDAGLADGAPADAAELELARQWLDHDPRDALERIRCPILALFGGADRVVPVDESVAVYEAARRRRPGGLRVEVFEGGDHRIRVGEPPRLHPDHLPTLTRWIRSVVSKG
jgi:pimeloyl-ACP methyl ester carboxylesterase